MPKLRPAVIILVMLALALTGLSGCIMPEDLQDPEGDAENDGTSHRQTTADCDDTAGSAGGSTGSDGTTEDKTDPADAYTDASPRYANSIDGRESSTRTIDVPLGTDRLRVALIHDSDARVSFTVSDPLFRTKAEESARGEKYLDEEEWLVVHDPVPGDWSLEISVRGQSSYTVGFYLDD